MKRRVCAGQSLVESVITLGVVILLVAGLVIGTTSSLRYADNSRTRSLATQYASEGLEIARKDRDAGWSTFARAGSFCVDATGSIPSDPCTPIDGRFTRMLLYEPNTTTGDATQVDVTSTVTWDDASKTNNSISLKTTLTHWK